MNLSELKNIAPLIKPIAQKIQIIEQKNEIVEKEPIVVLYNDPVQDQTQLMTYQPQVPNLNHTFWPHGFLTPITLPGTAGIVHFYDNARSFGVLKKRYVPGQRSLVISHNLYVLLSVPPRMHSNGFKLTLVDVRKGIPVNAVWKLNRGTKITANCHDLIENEKIKIAFLSGVHTKGEQERSLFQFEVRDSTDKIVAKTLDFYLYSSVSVRGKRTFEYDVKSTKKTKIDQ